MFHVKHLKNYYEILFLIFVFAIPFQLRTIINPAGSYIDSYFSYHETIFFYLTDILFLAFFVSWLLFSEAKNIKSPIFLKIVALISLIFITLFHVKRLDLGFYQALKWAEMLGLAIYCWQYLTSSDRLNQILGIIYVSGIFQAVAGIWQFHVQHSLGLRWLGEYIASLGTPGLATIDVLGVKLVRAYGTMPHPNILGGFLVITLIIGLFYVSRETLVKKWPKLAVSCGTIIVILGIFFTFSRVAWFAAALAVLAFLLFNVKAKNRTALATMAIILIVSCGTIFLGYKNLARARATEKVGTAAVTLRAGFNQMGIEVIKKYPVLGVGVGNYAEAQKDLFTLEGWQHQPPHNIYLFLAAELGILGLGLFLIVIFEILKQGWNVIGEPLGFTLISALVLILFMGLFDHYFITIQQGRLILFTVLGMTWALANSPN